VFSLAVEFGTDPGSDFGSEEFDGLEHLGVRHAADVHLENWRMCPRWWCRSMMRPAISSGSPAKTMPPGE
jgi:hypothetical protein